MNIREEKRQLEAKILELIQEFQDRHEVEVRGIQLALGRSLADNFSLVRRVEIEAFI